MKLSKFVLLGFFLSQSLGYSAHAVDSETLAKALKWVKEKYSEQKQKDDEEQKKEEVDSKVQVESKKQHQEQVKEEQESDDETALAPAPFASQMTLDYATVVDISKYKGTTFFSMMERVVKPALDQYAQKGFRVVDGNAAVAALSKVAPKVSKGAIRAAGSVEQLKKIGDQLAATHANVTFYNLPALIAEAGGGPGRFNLTTYFALVSGGGVAVRIEDGSYAYNVNYGSGAVPKDEMTGRSFGEAPGRLALDASDSHYLQMLERYVRTSGTAVESFYRSMLDILMNNDTSNYNRISDEGKAVAADFIAVYVAEQDRHLMANLQSHHWDQALLEVTLLSAFHAGQSQVAVMYQDRLSNRTHRQDDGCSTDAKVEKDAGMVDYWQFSSNTDPQHCNRSGINITKRQFRKLGRMITNFERKRNPKLIAGIEKRMKGIQISGNLFADLSTFLINYHTPKSLDAKTLALASEFTEFLMYVRTDADEITAEIKKLEQVPVVQ